ncbi:uncharacterized protein NPIL_406462 [Nephila pilipes]|uniref:Uncharacterized protein n=1 Tax=Nephila pilipes TaxID=299642 RepID=A0A8X6MIK2_NEPPI|nr:uncharacterized protein NPIL_406462 [Nephila pilipes]
MSESNKRKFWKIRFTGKLLRSAIFVVCVACFSWQSADFLQLYFSYPTATSVDITFPEVLIKPAVTLCNSNPVNRRSFCGKYPHLCQAPNNLTKFCKTYPYFCEYDTSDLVIPKLGYYANDSTNGTHHALLEIYTQNIIKDGADYWSWERPYKSGRGSKLKSTFFYDYRRMVYITCYSSNLHIYGSEEVETTYSNETFRIPNSMNIFVAAIQDLDSFYPWTVPRLLLSVHSPFVPIDPVDEGVLLEKYHEYFIHLKLEEQHLLGSPYQTNCTDYEYLWKKNNKTGPRSQEVFLETIIDSYLKAVHTVRNISLLIVPIFFRCADNGVGGTFLSRAMVVRMDLLC